MPQARFSKWPDHGAPRSFSIRSGTLSKKTPSFCEPPIGNSIARPLGGQTASGRSPWSTRTSRFLPRTRFSFEYLFRHNERISFSSRLLSKGIFDPALHPLRCLTCASVLSAQLSLDKLKDALAGMDYLLSVKLSESDLLKVNTLYSDFVGQVITVGNHAKTCSADSLARLNVLVRHRVGENVGAVAEKLSNAEQQSEILFLHGGAGSSSNASAAKDLKFRRLLSKLTRISKDSNELFEIGLFITTSFPSIEQSTIFLERQSKLWSQLSVNGDNDILKNELEVMAALCGISFRLLERRQTHDVSTFAGLENATVGGWNPSAVAAVIQDVFSRLFRFSTQSADCRFFQDKVNGPFMQKVEFRMLKSAINQTNSSTTPLFTTTAPSSAIIPSTRGLSAVPKFPGTKDNKSGGGKGGGGGTKGGVAEVGKGAAFPQKRPAPSGGPPVAKGTIFSSDVNDFWKVKWTDLEATDTTGKLEFYQFRLSGAPGAGGPLVGIRAIWEEEKNAKGQNVDISKVTCRQDKVSRMFKINFGATKAMLNSVHGAQTCTYCWTVYGSWVGHMTESCPDGNFIPIDKHKFLPACFRCGTPHFSNAINFCPNASGNKKSKKS